MNIDKNASVALFVGAGAVKNAWSPIIKASQPDYFKTTLTTEGATSSLARLVYLLRWFSNDGDKDSLALCKQLLESTKKRICDEIKLSQQNKEIFIREEFKDIVEQIVFSNCHRLMIVSANWDTIVEDAINNIPALINLFNNQKIIAAHIHGTYLDPQNIYLPTEVTEEPYRTDEEKKYFRMMHSSVLRSIITADTIIIYGLAVSPLDAELTQLLCAGINNHNVRTIEIIDPCHKIVAERINILLQFPTKVIVRGYDPQDLNTFYDYSFAS